jgi:RNA polymerase sigma factor (TIGR02999 family)
MAEVTHLLRMARESGDRGAIDQVVALLYPDLHRLAMARLARNGTITQLDATSIVHETYERLIGSGQLDAACRGQFLAYASQVMRSVIIDHVRKRRAGRRGADAVKVTLSTGVLNQASSDDADVERVNDAIEELEAADPRLKQVVEMRYFGGFEEREIAAALGLTERTVRRDWKRAQLMLQVMIRR